MPGLQTWIKATLIILVLTNCSVALDLQLPEQIQVGQETTVSINGLTQSAFLIVNSDFHTEVIELQAGQNEHRFVPEHTGVLTFTVKTSDDEQRVRRAVESSSKATHTRLELNPRSEPAGLGEIQVISWSWDEHYNSVPPPSSLSVQFPDGKRELELEPVGIVSGRVLQTTSKIGIAEVRLGEESATFRQVPGPPEEFRLTRYGETIRTSTLVDRFGNILEDGTVAHWSLSKNGKTLATAEVSVLNGIVTVPLEGETGREVRLEIEVLGQSAWLELSD